MVSARIISLAFCVLCVFQVQAAGGIRCQEINPSLPAAIQQALWSTVSVHSVIALDTEHLQNNTASISTTGSGFVLDTAGRVVMSGHGIAGFLLAEHPSRHTVILSDCRQFQAQVVVVGGDENYGVDAVILQIQHPPPDLIPMRRSEELPYKAKVYAMGSPYGIMNTVYEGVFGSSYINQSNERLYAYINLQDGISGGALVTEDGVMVGTAQGKGYLMLEHSELPVSFFVPVGKINQLLQKHNL